MALQAPNMSGFVDNMRAKYPNEWEKCKHPNDDGSFIRAVAKELLQEHGDRWGLNAKRDGPSSDISKDCVSYWRGPTDRHVEVIDVIVQHEGPGASIGWNNVTVENTMGNPGTARYVHPVNGGGHQTSEPGPVPGEHYTIPEALNYLEGRNGGQPLSATQTSTAINRAQQLGWTGGPTILKKIVHQIGDEMFPVSTTEIQTTLSVPFQGHQAGTKLTIKIG